LTTVSFAAAYWRGPGIGPNRYRTVGCGPFGGVVVVVVISDSAGPLFCPIPVPPYATETGLRSASVRGKLLARFNVSNSRQ